MGWEEIERMPPRVREKYLEMIRAIPPARKLRQVFEYSDFIRSMMVAGIRAERPGIQEEGIRQELRKRLLPPELRKKAYGQ